MYKCKHCNQLFDTISKPTGWAANHSRWCDRNPKRSEYASALTQARAAIVQPKNQYTKAKEEGRAIISPLLGKESPLKGKILSEETKEKIRTKALQSTHRRLVKSTRTYVCKNGSTVLLDSSWEEALAKRLDSLNINWVRPKDPIKWIDSKGTTRNYFPDFYLPDHDMFLDPKNPYAIASQKEKLAVILTQLPNLQLIQSLHECKNFNLLSN